MQSLLANMSRYICRSKKHDTWMEAFQQYFQDSEAQVSNWTTYVGGWTDSPQDLEVEVEIAAELS